MVRYPTDQAADNHLLFLTNKGHDVAKAKSVLGQPSQVVEILVLKLAVLEAQAEVLRRRLPLVLRRWGLTFAGEKES